MNLNELRETVQGITIDLKDNGRYPKENHLVDYKATLNISSTKNEVENFMINVGRDIISFSNSDGGIILFGVKEDKASGQFDDVGLDAGTLQLLAKIDLNAISQQFDKIVKVGVSIDLQQFQISSRKFYYLLIEKQTNVLIPINDYLEFKIKKGEVIYRASSKNEIANLTTADFNRFLQIKANEKSKEFLEIWSKLLPEMVDINPREVLIINPITNKVYGFNGKENVLSSSEVEVEKAENGIFNVILNAISAGEIGKITDNEGKPLYKIVGEIKNHSSMKHITMSTLEGELKKVSKFTISSLHIKQVLHYLGWVNNAIFAIESPSDDLIDENYTAFIWIEKFDAMKNTSKVVFDESAIKPILEVINKKSLHQEVFGKALNAKTKL